MTRPHPRRILARIVSALAACVALAVSLRAPAQQLGEGMQRSGTVGIQSDVERRIFGGLLCPCGCPREAISTCTCSFAHEYRDEVRGLIAQGLTNDQIQAEWVKRFGTKALAVPPNSGVSQLLYLAPIGAIIGMAGVVVIVLRRFRRRDGDKPIEAAPAGGRDEYDAKLDEELKRLDDEGDQ